MKLLVYINMTIVLLLMVSGCVEDQSVTQSERLTILSPHPLEFIDPIIGEFENATGIQVEIVSAGTGELLSRIENNEVGDVLWGGSLSTLEPKKELFEPYFSENEAYAIDKNEDGAITRFTLVPSVIMVNSNLIGNIQIEGYQDLLNPELKGRIAFADPSKSSSSYEQLINQLWAFKGDSIHDGWSYVDQLLLNMDGILLNSSRDVYTGVVEGEFFVGLTFEEAAAKYVQIGAPINIIYPKEGTIVRPDGVSIIKGSSQLEQAQAFVDFVTSYEIQALIASELNRRSIRSDIDQAIGLKSYEDIVILEDDQEWSSKNKYNILSTFKAHYEASKR